MIPTVPESCNLDGIMGRCLVEWHIGEDGLHFDLDDGKVLILTGAFIIAIMKPDECPLH